MYSVTESFVTWLADAGYRASTQPPKSGAPFVTVERTGGTVSNLVDHPQMAIQCWAKTEPEAEAMANSIRFALVTGDRPSGVHHVAVNAGPYPFWDESTRMPRYQIALDVTAQLTE